MKYFLICLLLINTLQYVNALESPAELRHKIENTKPNKLKGYNELLNLVETEIATAVRGNQYSTVIAIARYNYKTVDAIIARLKQNGYTVQTNTNKKYKSAMVVSWDQPK